MDFDLAARRLARDQPRRRTNNRILSAKATQEAAKRRQLDADRQQARRLQKQRLEYQQARFRQCERALGMQSLRNVATDSTTAVSTTLSSSSLLLQATSIYGEGDKIALPPSILETLTKTDRPQQPQQQPWMFRIGILNPNYAFPASEALRKLRPPDEQDDSDSDTDDENDVNALYQDELQCKYLAYTHGTVVEFTQEEGYVGLPEPIAKAILSSSSDTPIPTIRTVDKAANTHSDTDEFMQTDDDDQGEKTPGHVAWGAFEVPNIPVEVSLVRLPKGKTARLVAQQTAFYALPDIKLVLEQSLVRTRATLSLHDVVTTWHRGVQYDLRVVAVTPALWGSVSCINTDIEIEFGEVESTSTGEKSPTNGLHDTSAQSSEGSSSRNLGGRLLGDHSTTALALPALESTNIPSQTAGNAALPSEPPADQTENVVTIKVRLPSATAQRRFDTTIHTIDDVYAFSSLAVDYQLVTRFPRRVLARTKGSHTLQQAGIQSGQELLVAEKIP